jgi:flagellar hook-associated protein 3 FlgL
MRITNSMLVNNMLSHVSTNLNRMDKLQQKMATGKKIVVPSDDPIVASRALKLRTDVSELEQFERNTKDADSWLQMTDSSLDKLTSVLQRTRELTVDGSSESKTPNDMLKIAEEIAELKDQAIHLGNSTYAGRYIFSGHKTNSKLIIDDKSDVNYGKFNISVESDVEKVKFEIGVSDRMAINTPGGEIFNYLNEANIIQGTATGETAVVFGPTLDIIAATNDTFQLTVDGESVNVTLTPGSYPNIAALSAQIEADINATTTIANDVSVSNDGNGMIQITSGSNGPISEVVINGGTSLVDLGLDSVVEVVGANTDAITSGSTTGNSGYNLAMASGTLLMSVDGEEISVTLTGGYATFADLANDVETKVNAATNRSKDIVLIDNAGSIQMFSGSTGVTSELIIKGGTALADLGMQSVNVVKGKDVGNSLANTNGYVMGTSAITSLTINAGVNDTLNLNVDGVAISITIPDIGGAYSDSDAIASAVETEINSNIAVVNPVSVRAVGNKLLFESGSYGSSSQIVIDPASNAASNLGIDVTNSYSGTSAITGSLIQDFDDLMTALESGNGNNVSAILTRLDDALDNVLKIRADIGARQNRVELTLNRLSDDYISFTKLLSDNEDADIAEVIMKLKSEENVYNASLAAGARIIQPTLMDFLR